MLASFKQWTTRLTNRQESDECARWSKLLANDVKDGSRHNQMMTYKSIRETFGYSDYGQTTILHISSLQVRPLIVWRQPQSTEI